ncbi:DUF7281 domain-containing protein [Methylobacter svalbardensis]|uniref:DUF7281 domain-containing protein n=1 Tax=Methylobacter svalbardensis TaxID=3080016 RepID=UPI0030EF10A9
MNRKTFKWVSDLVTSNPGQTTTRLKSAMGCTVIERYQSGLIQNNKLIFTALDKTALRRKIIQEFNLDPFNTDQLPASRIEVAKHHNNEKLAKNPVSYDHILLNCPNKTLKLNNQAIQLQTESIPNAGMMCLSSGITRIDHDAIVVVENLAIMQLCSAFTLPAPCQNALWIYRGDHKTGAKIDACHDLLKRFGNNKAVIVFSDMDPKGLEIALTIPYASYWLGPEPSTWNNCFNSNYASRSGYDKQGDTMVSLLKRCDTGFLAEPFRDLILRMKNERSSYRQEHSYAHNVRLSLFPIKQEISKLI